MKPAKPDDPLAQALRADARRMAPAFSRKLHEDTLWALNAGVVPHQRLASGIRRSGTGFFGPAGLVLAAMCVGVLLFWRAMPIPKMPNKISPAVATTVAKPVGPNLTTDDFAPARFINSPGELMTRSLNFAQQAISEQYAMTYASTVRSAQENLPQFGFYSIPNIRATSSH